MRNVWFERTIPKPSKPIPLAGVNTCLRQSHLGHAFVEVVSAALAGHRVAGGRVPHRELVAMRAS